MSDRNKKIQKWIDSCPSSHHCSWEHVIHKHIVTCDGVATGEEVWLKTISVNVDID